MASAARRPTTTRGTFTGQAKPTIAPGQNGENNFNGGYDSLAPQKDYTGTVQNGWRWNGYEWKPDVQVDGGEEIESVQHPYTQTPVFQPPPGMTGGDSGGNHGGDSLGEMVDKGRFEKWGDAHAGKYDEPKRLPGYWDEWKQYYNPNNATYGETTGREAADDLRNPSEGETIATDAAREMMNGRAYGEEWWNNHGQEYDKPSWMEDYAKQVDLAALARGQNPYSANVDKMMSEWDMIHNAEDWFRDSKGQLIQKGYTEKMADQYKPELSYSEQFLLGDGTQGLDKYFDDLHAKKARLLDDRVAAGGSYNSGAAVRANEELSRDIIDQQVLKRMELSNQADVQKMARLGEGRTLMQGADTALNNRLTTGGNLARNADISAGERASGKQSVYKGDAEARLAAIAQGGKVAGDAQDAWMRRINSGSAASVAAQTARTNRYAGAAAAGTAAAGVRTMRNNVRAGIADGVDTATQRRAAGGAGIAGAADTGDLAWLNAGGDMANQLQKAFEGRLRGGLQDATAFATTLAGIFGQQKGAAIAEQMSAGMDEIQGLLQKGAITEEEAYRRVEDLYKNISIGASGYLNRPGAKTDTGTPYKGTTV